MVSLGLALAMTTSMIGSVNVLADEVTIGMTVNNPTADYTMTIPSSVNNLTAGFNQLE